MPGLEIKKKKAEKIFQFMKALNELRNPVATDLGEYKWSVHINENLPNVEECESVFENEELEYVLRVGRPELTSCPKPEEGLLEWLESGWDKLRKEPKVLESRTITSEYDEEEDKVLYFNEVKGLKKMFETWKDLRDKWKLLEGEKVKCIDLYDRLFSLRSTIQRDAESLELILGDGFLTWNLNDGRYIKQPILLQRLKLKFEPSIPEFIIKLEDSNTELYTALLRTIEATDKKTLGTLVDDLKENNYQIIEQDETNSYLKRFITSVVSNGKFIDVADQIELNQPMLYRQPVIFLRKRTLGYSIMIDAILEDIKKQINYLNL